MESSSEGPIPKSKTTRVCPNISVKWISWVVMSAITFAELATGMVIRIGREGCASLNARSAVSKAMRWPCVREMMQSRVEEEGS